MRHPSVTSLLPPAPANPRAQAPRVRPEERPRQAFALPEQASERAVERARPGDRRDEPQPGARAEAPRRQDPPKRADRAERPDRAERSEKAGRPAAEEPNPDGRGRIDPSRRTDPPRSDASVEEAKAAQAGDEVSEAGEPEAPPEEGEAASIEADTAVAVVPVETGTSGSEGGEQQPGGEPPAGRAAPAAETAAVPAPYKIELLATAPATPAAPEAGSEAAGGPAPAVRSGPPALAAVAAGAPSPPEAPSPPGAPFPAGSPASTVAGGEAGPVGDDGKAISPAKPDAAFVPRDKPEAAPPRNGAEPARSDILRALEALTPGGTSTAPPPSSGAAPAASGPAASSAAAPPQGAAPPGQPTPVVPNVPLGAVPMEIGLRSMAGMNRFEIRLNPDELGRIDVRLDIGEDGTVKAHLAVDRVETLALLQRDAKTLERAFEQAGLKPSEGGVDLSLRDPGGGGRDREPGREPGRSPARGPSEPPPERILNPAAFRPLRAGATGLDLRI